MENPFLLMGNPEMETLNKQAKAVQLQRLSEGTSCMGEATVWSYGNENHKKMAEMTISAQDNLSWAGNRMFSRLLVLSLLPSRFFEVVDVRKN